MIKYGARDAFISRLSRGACQGMQNKVAHPTFLVSGRTAVRPYNLFPYWEGLGVGLYTLHPTPYTLHPTPYTLHPTPSPDRVSKNMRFSRHQSLRAWSNSYT